LTLDVLGFRTIRVAAENSRDPAVRLRVDRFEHSRLGDIARSNESPSELFSCLSHKVEGMIDLLDTRKVLFSRSDEEEILAHAAGILT
jgi:hypothetical protein